MGRGGAGTAQRPAVTRSRPPRTELDELARLEHRHHEALENLAEAQRLYGVELSAFGRALRTGEAENSDWPAIHARAQGLIDQADAQARSAGLAVAACRADRVREFLDAALADGFRIQSEQGERVTLVRTDGFKLTASRGGQIPTGSGPRYSGNATVAGWAPDGLTVELPAAYSGDSLRQAADTCQLCGASPAREQFSYAGRCCSREKHAMQIAGIERSMSR
jgi:hypothetical protein